MVRWQFFWKCLVVDVEEGKMVYLLCKDFRQISRNYLQTGFYTGAMFQQYGAHFLPSIALAAMNRKVVR